MPRYIGQADVILAVNFRHADAALRGLLNTSDFARFFHPKNSSYSPLLFLESYGIMCHRWVAEVKVIIEVANRMHGICRWYPPTTEGRSRRRRWLQGCEEGHEAPRQRVLVEARRVECHAERDLTRIQPKPAAEPRNLACGGLSSFRRATTPPARKSPTQANVARSDGLGVELALMALIAVCFHVIDVHRVGVAGGSAVLNVPHAPS